MDLLKKQSFLREKIASFVERQGFKVFDVRLFYSSGRLFLRIFADYINGGISLDDCALINRRVSSYIDEQALLEETFTLEVSSPGLNRDLKQPVDFLRVKDREICLWLTQDFQGRSYYEARVADVDLDKQTVCLESGGNKLYMPVNIIRKARQRLV